ncbi:MAG: hypothetical protein JNL96_15085 [Planctomycetaceae bacterium]|nr:hypothetical protein [Planctomycetaceae bacterium]
MSKTALATSPKAAASAADAESAEVKIEMRPDKEGAAKMFGIVFNSEPDVVHKQPGRDDREAWALFCDGRKTWPTPKSAVVVEIAKGDKDEEVAAKAKVAREAKTAAK